MKKGRVMMDSKSNMTSSATCQRGFRAVSEITVKNLANYLKLDYGSLAEEEIFRRAAYHVNELCQRFRKDQPDKPLQYSLAKTALAFAELYYRKSEQLAEQSRMIDEFEKSLDAVLLSTE